MTTTVAVFALAELDLDLDAYELSEQDLEPLTDDELASALLALTPAWPERTETWR